MGRLVLPASEISSLFGNKLLRLPFQNLRLVFLKKWHAENSQWLIGNVIKVPSFKKKEKKKENFLDL